MSHNCPNCGTALEPRFAHVKVMDCDSCGTSLYLDNDAFHLAGEQGVMHDAPLLFDLGDRVVIDGQTFVPIGHARFSYGPGWWDEFWVETEDHKGAWISIDEGDVVLQRPTTGRAKFKFPSLTLGAVCSYLNEDYTITELDTATCIARRGAFPELLTVGETYQFVNATGPYGALLSGEITADGATWFFGRWIDPFDVKVNP